MPDPLVSEWLNDHQLQSVVIALRVFEERLREADAALRGKESDGILVVPVIHLGQDEVELARSRIAQALDEIAVMARDLSLEPKPDDVKATIRGMMSASWVDLMDVRSVALRRYGGVDPRVELGLDPVVERLAQLALSIASLMGG